MAEYLAPTVVRGRVTDEAGRPLESAQVSVDGTRFGALSGPDGHFTIQIDSLPRSALARAWDVTAQSIGYEPVRHAVALGGGGAEAVDFKLAPQSLALGEIVVTGAAAPAPKSAAALPNVTLSAAEDPDAWSTVDRAAAESVAGFRLVTVPDLPIVRIQTQEVGETTLVRVVQDLGDGTVLDLVEGLAGVRFEGVAPRDGRRRGVVRVGTVTVAAAAPVSTDALAALLGRLR
jgi:hypothetical protein